MKTLPPILDIGDILISSDIITEHFCCDYEKCKGICCVEGDAGAPVTIDEVAHLEKALDTVWNDLSAQAQNVIDRQGVVYNDRDGDLVTSIVNGRECVFAKEASLQLSPIGGMSNVTKCWICTLERAWECGSEGARGTFIKPISCSLYPIREKRFSNGLIGLNYHRWEVCRDAVEKGKREDIPVYKFLKEPLIRRFGEEWYQELCNVATLLMNSSVG